MNPVKLKDGDKVYLPYGGVGTLSDVDEQTGWAWAYVDAGRGYAVRLDSVKLVPVPEEDE